MFSTRPTVSVVIPNRDGITPRDGLKYLEMVLSSLREQSFQDFDVTVVDDGSTDESVGYLRSEWPEVGIVQLDEGSGFPAVVNRGIEASDGPYIALLNNDIELAPGWLEHLVRELDRDPALGFVTSKVKGYWNREIIDEAGHDLYTCGRFAPRGMGEEDVGQYDERSSTPIVTAAAALYRRSAVEAVGCLDEDYFFYCEDADLCLRMVMAGYGGLYVPDTEAYHVRGGTVGQQSELATFHLIRNSLITLTKDLPAPVLVSALPKILLYQYGTVTDAWRRGFLRTVFRAYGSFVRMLPATLRKRRRVQRQRVISTAEMRSQLRTEYPIPTRFGRLLGSPN